MESGSSVRSYSELHRSYREGSKCGSLWSGFVSDWAQAAELLSSSGPDAPQASEMATLDQLSPTFII